MRIVVTALAVAVVAAVRSVASGGTIKGTVRFDGPPPERAPVRRDTDPYCNHGEVLSDEVVVTDGKLRDVLVRVTRGAAPDRKAAAVRAPAAPAPAAPGPAVPAPAVPAPAVPAPAVPAPAVIDQRACAYTPRVLGVMAGQQLVVRNSDGTFHNVHGTIAGKLVWNKPAAPGDPPLILDGSARAGDVIDIVCDVHPWMHAYAVVQDRAGFAVTGDDGSFELTGLPPGSYTIEAWHPTLGTRTVTVKLGARAAATAQLAFQRGERT